MRRLLLAAVLLAGCGDRRTFDEKFNDTEAELQKRSAELDRRLEAEQNSINETEADASVR
jgi:hypothetical protein